MRYTTFNSLLVNKPKLRNNENKDWSGYYASIVLAAGGGLFFLLLGFFLFVIFTVSGGNNLPLNNAGVGSIIVAFIFFGFGAHFMDKSDEGNRRCKRKRIEKFNRK
jgi:membrane protein implicated in regulation of membrane protease activity